VRFIIGDEDPFINAIDKDAVLERIKSNGLKVEVHEFKGGHDLNLALVKSLM
jgi:predicted esterase